MSGSKLSLSKKLQKFARVKDKPKEKLVNVFTETVNLNETSEFQNASSFSTGNVVVGGRLNRRCKDIAEDLGDDCAEGKGDACEAESFVCQVCSKDLAHMTIQRRQQHVNRCIDKTEDVEKQKKEEERLLESARTAVLNCPICGKQFKSSTARLGHLKKCSRENNVSTDRLLQLIKDQEKERTDQLAAGIIPPELRTKISKTAVVKKRKLKEPKTQYEEDVQVAMAISSSITGEQQATGSMVTKGKVSGKKKDKEMLEDVCLLTTLSDEDRQKRMEEKISNILQMSINHTADSSAILYESELKASHQSASLWNICSSAPDSCKKEEFYVGALIPPICMSSGVEPGRSVHRLFSIPGREKSFIEANQELLDKGMNVSTNLSSDDIISVSTQTAIVLAELAADHTEDTDIQNMSQPFNATCDVLEASGFCVDMMTLDDSVQERLYTDILTDYRKLVNNPEHSDVDIVSSSGDILYAHKLILLLRCPAMLQTVKESTIHLDYPTAVVKCALKFLYTGELTVAGSVQNELKKLAIQYELPPLISACDKLKLIGSKATDEIEGIVDHVSEKEATELNMKEIWGESDSEPEAEDIVKDDLEKLSDNEIEDTDYRDIMATQRKSLKNRENVCNIDKTESELKETEVVESPANIRKTLSNTLKSNCVKGVGSSAVTETEKIPAKHNLPDTADDDISMDVEDDMPKPKRLRLSDELETAKCKNTEFKVKHNQSESIVLSDSSDEDMSVNQEHVGKDCSGTPLAVDDGPGEELNDSYCVNTSVDLFASPSPPPKPEPSNMRSKQTLSEMGESSGSFNTPSRTLAARSDTNEAPAKKSKKCLKENAECSELSHDGELSDVRVNFSGGGNNDVNELDENSGDDIEITGDNFNELCTPSPTFNRSKTNSMPRFESPKLDLKSKYLGFENTIVKRCDKYPRIGGNQGDDNEDSDEVILMQTEDEGDAEKSEGENFMGDGKNVQLSILEESGSHKDISVNDMNSDIPEPVKVDAETVSDTGEPGIDGSESTSESENQRSPTIPTIHSESFQVHSDVWEDFDDCGVMYEPSFVSPEQPASQVPSASPKPSCSKSEQNEEDDITHDAPVEDAQDGITHDASVEYDVTHDALLEDAQDGITYDAPVVDDITHDSPVEDELYQDFLQDGDDSFVFKVDDDITDDAKQQDSVPAKTTSDKVWNFKTPVVKRTDNKKKVWMVPSPFTPMPKYTDMATPNLKKEVHKFGVKAVGKKRMVKILEDIYQQTHQYETDSDLDDDEKDVNDQSGDTENTGQDSDSPSDMGEELMSSQWDITSQESHMVMEESCLHMSSSDSDTTASPQKNVDVSKKLTHYFKSHPELHLKVLTFEPIELDVLKKDVKEYGIKCSMDKLMDFLDEKCIAFTTKNSRKNRAQKKRGKKKPTTSKISKNDT